MIIKSRKGISEINSILIVILAIILVLLLWQINVNSEKNQDSIDRFQEFCDKNQLKYDPSARECLETKNQYITARYGIVEINNTMYLERQEPIK